MIPLQFVELWRANAKWQDLELVEHDLVISRALVELYSEPLVQEGLVFRGGTALNKLFLNPASRYSEDLDFVFRKSEPIGPTLDAIRSRLDPLLGAPKRQLTQYGAKVVYRYTSYNNVPMKLKIEINTTEKFGVLELLYTPFIVESEWYTGSCTITTYTLEELMATKLRALFQRRKGRDLFDIAHVFGNNLADIELTISLFKKYTEREGVTISGSEFYKNLQGKLLHDGFRHDMRILLPETVTWDFDEAFEFVLTTIVTKIP